MTYLPLPVSFELLVQHEVTSWLSTNRRNGLNAKDKGEENGNLVHLSTLQPFLSKESHALHYRRCRCCRCFFALSLQGRPFSFVSRLLVHVPLALHCKREGRTAGTSTVHRSLRRCNFRIPSTMPSWGISSPVMPHSFELD